jgi:threonine dehydratase
MSVTFDQIIAARRRLGEGVRHTSCDEAVPLTEICDCRVFAKKEYLQRTGSFKERGARNALLLLQESGAEIKGVIAASAGNHALALAYHGRDLGIPVTVVMPIFAPLIKQERCAQMGARVLLDGANIGEAKVRAEELVAAEGLTYVHGFDDPAVIAGQGTIGLEIMEQVPDADAIICPIGGGGLIAGLALAVKTMNPHVEIIGVESGNTGSFQEALRQNGPVLTKLKPSLADGLAVPMVGANAFAVARDRVDQVVEVDEADIALAILRLVELQKGVVEGAGATPLAAILGGKVPHLKGKNVVIILAGGNIDPTVLSRVMERGLVADGRLAQFKAIIEDRPGGLAHLATTIGDAGASIREVVHERAFTAADVRSVEVECTLETRSHAHIESVVKALELAGIRVFTDHSVGEFISRR